MGFDDIVIYKSKENIIMDTNWEDKLCAEKICGGSTAETLPNIELKNASNCNDDVTTAKYSLNKILRPGETAKTNCNNENTVSYRATCGKYGIWSKYATEDKCETEYIVAMWSGTENTTPEGWEVCDGGPEEANDSDKRPDLRNRFIIGASSDADNNKQNIDCEEDNDCHVGKLGEKVLMLLLLSIKKAATKK